MGKYYHHHRHHDWERPNPKVKLVIGALIIFIGLMLLIRNTGIVPWYINNILFSWQAFLIGLGIIFTVGRHSSTTGVVLISIGTFFILPELFPSLSYNFSEMFWPLILIVIGISFIMKRGRRFDKDFQENTHEQQANSNTTTDDETSYINEVAIFGGSKHQIMNKNIKGGRIIAIFGGAELDFRPATLGEGIKTIELVCMFGGVSLIVPADWNVQINVVSILGGFVDKRFIPAELVTDNNKTVVIKGVAIFGGGDIKSHP